LFVAIYNFFHRQKPLFWTLFLILFAGLVMLASRIRFQEDISSMLPDSKAIHAMNDVISHTQAGEQVIFQVSFTDTALTDRDSLIAASTSFYTGLQERCAQWIDTINLQIGGGMEEAMVATFRDNLPLFLTAQDFQQLDTLLQPQRIRATLENNRKLLMSPASVVYKTLVATDPVGMSGLVWQKLATLQFDPDYETYDGYIFSKDGSRLTFFLKPVHKAAETGKNSTFFSALNDYQDQWQQQHPGIHITYFGGPAVAAGNATQLRTDTIVTLSITIILLIALTFYYFRRKRTPLLILVPVAFGAAFGLAITYLVQGSVSIIALGAGAIVMGIAIDYSMHFLSHARHTPDVRDTIRELQQPLTIGSFTTIAAFLSLRLVHTPILRDLGLFAACSLIGAALCTLVFLPHFPLGKTDTKPRFTIFDKMARWQPERNKWLLLFIVLVTPVMLYFSFRVQFDDDLMHLNYLSPRMQQAQDEVSKANAFALSSVFLVAHEDNEEQALQQLESLSPAIDSLTRKGWVRSASNPVVLLPSAQEQRTRIQRWQAFWTPAKITSVLQSVHQAAGELGYNIAAFEGFQASLSRPYQPLDTVTVNMLKQLYPGGFSSDKENRYAIAALKVPAEHRRQVFEVLGAQQGVTVTDKQQGAAQMVKLLNTDFNNIAIYTTFIVFFALLIGYGRVELALMSFLPMAISWIWILGLMAMLGLKFNIVNIIISTLIFGLGDDYSIFTLDGLMDRYKLGNKKLHSVRAAVYVSVVTVLIGLGVLLLAKHPALKSIAFISVTGIICVVFISQTLQPFLFNFFIQKRADKGFLPFTLWSFTKSVFSLFYFALGSMVMTVVGFFLIRLWPFNKEKGKYIFHRILSNYTWSVLHIMTNVRKRYLNKQVADFSKPAVYIANHSSFLDILITTSIHPKVILLTNKWVWKSPIFGKVVKMAEYYPVADGAENSLVPLQGLINRGYSIVVFPEGTRSYTDKIHRFHKGAFFIAEQLGLDIVPIVLHGVHYSMQKGDFLLKNGNYSVNYYPPVKPDDTSLGKTYSERAKGFGRFFRTELERIKEREETPAYFREQLIRSYTYKGPVLEWYCRVKTKLEGNYEQFHTMIPRSGKFYDLGCGYGFMTYMLHWAARGREFTGVDYDAEKIEVAQHNFLRDEHIRFEQGDLNTYALQACDGIIISDVLHYLLPEQQQALLERCVAALNPGGKLIIRDGVKELEGRHKGTRLSEYFSTRMFKFNKTNNDLYFLSRQSIESFSGDHGLSLKIVDNTKLTSNLIFILQKPY